MTRILTATMAVATLVAAQQQPAKEFEVASIKPSQSADDRMLVRLNPGGRWSGRNVPVTLLIQEVFDVRAAEISGGPSWKGNELFDIDAKPESSGGDRPSSEALSAMFQSLLTTRFHLEFHREKREVSAYALVVGKSGIKMKESDPSVSKPSINVGLRGFKAFAMPTQMLANTLSRYLERPVTDETGLKQSYDITLEWTPDSYQGSDLLSADKGGGPSIFNAIQEQLGLKLESRKASISMFIIDRLDRPEPN